MAFDRRAFIKFMAGASAGIMVTPLPWKLLDDVSIWTQNWGWIPRLQHGPNSFVPVVSKMCPSAVAMQVRLVEGRPVRALPHPEHPLGGGVSALSVAEVQMTQSPGRVHAPLRRSADGAYVRITWAEAGEMLAARLKEAGASTAFVCGDETGSTLDVMAGFAAAIGSKDVFLMPSEGQAAAGAAKAMGVEAQLGYDLENSDYVLAIGSNILETWGTVVRNRRILVEKRPHPGEKAAPAAALVFAGPMQNQTAALAKPWVPILPGTEVTFALSLAEELIRRGRTVNSTDFNAFRRLAERNNAKDVAKITGVSPETVKTVVDALLAAKAPLVIAGGEGQGSAPVMAAVALNALLGNINKPGGLTLLPDAPQVVKGAASRRDVYANSLQGWLDAKKMPKALVLHEANPAYALPNPAAVKAALATIPFKVCFSTFMHETAALCDLVLPVPMGIERTDDIFTPYGAGKGIYCVTSPVVPADENARATADMLLFIAKQMKKDLGFAKFADVVKAKAEGLGAKLPALAKGTPKVLEATATADALRLRPELMDKATEAKFGSGTKLVVFSKLNLGTANTGIPPFNTKTLRATELAGHTMFAVMNGATAKAKGLEPNALVAVRAGKQSIPARVRVFEGLTPESVALCTGLGRTALDEFSQNKGANVMELLTATTEPETGLCVWSRTSVEVVKA
ncbi:menaquinone reductase molybdopterin-binding-like subunit QrcB [Desulfovibrio cuneatus]|uniref:menaquinone reductase molybdopterin-binding-like subunit QrcB n=1 Tax=Desulfovibrio cuneatus TaxID=159728 RepID=UPI000400AEC9|nr:menaquinone reductase molybdopterin-binding-like subunit QrcB [Desulfovibrio cuneatus]